jgi:cytochrome c-type protein NapC
MIRQRWQRLRERCATCSRVTLGLGIILLTMFIGGTLLAAGAAGLAWTNTEGFCIGCHEMRENVYAEFKDTIHDKNRSGVRAICSSCHVPHEPVALVVRKMQASLELWGHLTGKIDTKEKFEKHRYEMAVKEWTRMKKNGSQECRNCHHFEAMQADKQTERARTRHAKAQAQGTACIDCHSGIAHKEPDGPGPRELKLSGGTN